MGTTGAGMAIAIHPAIFRLRETIIAGSAIMTGRGELTAQVTARGAATVVIIIVGVRVTVFLCNAGTLVNTVGIAHITVPRLTTVLLADQPLAYGSMGSDSAIPSHDIAIDFRNDRSGLLFRGTGSDLKTVILNCFLDERRWEIRRLNRP